MCEGRRWTRKSGCDAMRGERDKRRSRLGVVVTAALAEHEAHGRVLGLRVGEALEGLIEEEGLTVLEAANWCAVGHGGDPTPSATPNAAASASIAYAGTRRGSA